MNALTFCIKNRAWMLPHFLGCVNTLDVDKATTAVIFLDDGSSDATLPMLQKWAKSKAGTAWASVKIIVQEGTGEANTNSRDTSNRLALYEHLADVRQTLLDEARAIDADWAFCADTDVLFAADTIQALLACDGAMVATIEYCDAAYSSLGVTGRELNRCINMGYIDGAGFHRSWTMYELDKVYPCQITGGVYLLKQSVLDSAVRYVHNAVQNSAGEDVGFCMELGKLDLTRVCDTTIRSVHVMKREQLGEALGWCYLQWGAVPLWKP